MRLDWHHEVSKNKKKTRARAQASPVMKRTMLFYILLLLTYQQIHGRTSKWQQNQIVYRIINLSDQPENYTRVGWAGVSLMEEAARSYGIFVWIRKKVLASDGDVHSLQNPRRCGQYHARVQGLVNMV